MSSRTAVGQLVNPRASGPRIKINLLGTALKCVQAFNQLVPQFNQDSSINYVYIGGIALAMQMLKASARPRNIGDIDVFILNTTAQYPDRRLKIHGKTFQLFGTMPFTELGVGPDDIAIIEHRDVKVAVIKPEFLLVSKIAKLRGLRALDIKDAHWILNNLQLDPEYFNQIAQRVTRGSCRRFTLDELLARGTNVRNLQRYLKAFT